MGSVKLKDLKAFVRYDGSGRVVSGSLVFRKKKPKNGRWVEITKNECCSETPSSTTTTTTQGGGGGNTPTAFLQIYWFNANNACTSTADGQFIVYSASSTLAEESAVFLDAALTIPVQFGYVIMGVEMGATKYVVGEGGTLSVLNCQTITSVYRIGYAGYTNTNDACANTGDINNGSTLYAPGAPYTMGQQLYYDSNYTSPYNSTGWYPIMVGWPSGTANYVFLSSGVISAYGDCSTITTTTTTTPIFYYLTNKYNCPDCSTITESNFLIKGSTPVNIGDWVVRSTVDGFLAFQVLSAASPDPSAYLVDTYGSSSTCPCPATTTTTTTAAVYTIGQAALGGIIAYINGGGTSGTSGLVATVADIIRGTDWGCDGTNITTSAELGTGNQNTIDIMAGCPTAGIAARLCGDLNEGGYSDWYLPSKDELSALYTNRVAIGGFDLSGNAYWSSTQRDQYDANAIEFASGATLFFTKNFNLLYVRAIRSF
jgi:hypothetical protein